MAEKFTIRQGDRLPWLAYKFPFSLADAVSVSFSLKDAKSEFVVIDRQPAVIADGTYDINGVATPLTPAHGVVFYPWATGDTADPRADALGMFHITWPGNLQESVPSEGYIPIVIGTNF